METGWIQSLNLWIQAHPNWVGVIIYLVAFAESLLLVGIIFPGAAFLVSLGALIGLGVIDLGSAWFWSSLGGFCGDGLSFWIGHRYRHNLLNVWPINRFPRSIEAGKAYFRKHAGKSVFIGRFVGPIRPVIPAIAGVMGMPVRRYLMISIVASILWAPFYILPGVAFGKSMQSIAQVAGKLALLIGMLVVGVWLVYWLVGLVYKWAVPKAYHVLSRALVWSQKHPRLGRFTAGLVDPRKPEKGTLAAMSAVILVVTALLITSLANIDLLRNWNRATEQFFHAFHNPWTETPVRWLLWLGHDLTLIMSAVLLSAWLLHRRLMLAFYHWLFVLASAWLLSLVVQFTSAHSATGWLLDSRLSLFVAMSGFWAILSAGAYPTRWRSWPYVFSGVLVLLVSFAQLFFFRQSLGGALISVFAASLMALGTGVAFRTHSRKQFLARPLILVFLLGLLLGSTLTGLWMANTTLESKPVLTLNAANGHTTRTDWINRNQQALDIVYEGDLAVLQAALQQRDWQFTEPATWSALYQALKVNPDKDPLPIIATVDNGRIEALIAYKAEGNARLALRLWPSANGQWRGSLMHLQRHRALYLFNYWKQQLDSEPEKASLMNDLRDSGRIEVMLDEARLLLREVKRPATD